MPVIGVPIDGGDNTPVVRPEDATMEGCAVRSKTRTILIDKGVESTVEWEMRDRNGVAINLVDFLGCTLDVDCGTVKVRIADGTNENSQVFYETTGTVVDATTGIVNVTIPDEISDVAGIYLMDFGILNSNDKVVLSNRGLLSVERGLFGELQNYTGPPTMQEIRMILRDTAVENDLLDAVEYSDAEILMSILRPLREFNESPPPLGYTFTATNFPWREAWMNAIASYLLMTAAHWYRRNKLNSAHGGLQLGDRDRDNPYMQVAMALREEWKTFIIRKKAELNVLQAYGSVGSPYGGYGYN